MAVTAVARAGWTQAELEDLLLELLADLLDHDAADLRPELLEKGALMPVDSLDLFDVLQEFRKRTGLCIPVRKLRSRTMRSVRLFAQFAAREGRS